MPDEVSIARAYIAQLRGDSTAPQWPSPAADVPAAPPPAGPMFAAVVEMTRADTVVEFVETAGGFELRDGTGTRLFADLVWADDDVVSFRTADATCHMGVERAGKLWSVVARSAVGAQPLAAFHTGWRPGGQIWVSPDDWFALRWTPLARASSWKLTADGVEVLRVRSSAADRYEIAISADLARPALLLLVACWGIMAETVPVSELVGDGDLMMFLDDGGF